MSATWGNSEKIYSLGVLPPVTHTGHRDPLPGPWSWLRTSARTGRDQRHRPRRDGVTNANMGVFRSVGVSLISCISSSTSKLSLKGDRSIWAVKELLADYVKSPSRRLACGWSAGRGSPKRVLKCSIACIFFDELLLTTVLGPSSSLEAKITCLLPFLGGPSLKRAATSRTPNRCRAWCRKSSAGIHRFCICGARRSRISSSVARRSAKATRSPCGLARAPAAGRRSGRAGP
jgi:hypothetical protein